MYSLVSWCVLACLSVPVFKFFYHRLLVVQKMLLELFIIINDFLLVVIVVFCPCVYIIYVYKCNIFRV